jgi:hypothetical protein
MQRGHEVSSSSTLIFFLLLQFELFGIRKSFEIRVEKIFSLIILSFNKL